MITRKIWFGAVAASLFVSGCGLTPKTTPTYINDGSQFENISSTTIPRGQSESYVPAPPAPIVPTTTAENATSAAITPESPAVALSPTSTVGTVNVQKVTPPAISYSKAIATYKTRGAYFQLVACRGTPGSISLKHGTKFMLDNRDPKAHVLRLGVNRYQVAPYGFVIVAAPSAGRYYITCDGGGSAFVNVAS